MNLYDRFCIVTNVLAFLVLLPIFVVGVAVRCLWFAAFARGVA